MHTSTHICNVTHTYTYVGETWQSHSTHVRIWKGKFLLQLTYWQCLDRKTDGQLLNSSMFFTLTFPANISHYKVIQVTVT